MAEVDPKQESSLDDRLKILEALLESMRPPSPPFPAKKSKPVAPVVVAEDESDPLPIPLPIPGKSPFLTGRHATLYGALLTALVTAIIGWLNSHSNCETLTKDKADLMAKIPRANIAGNAQQQDQGDDKPIEKRPPVVVPPVQPPSARALLKAKCAACHQEGTLYPKDQAFVMFSGAGTLHPFTDNEVLAMAAKVRGKTMPPPGNVKNIAAMTDAEIKTLLEFLK